MNSFNHYAYGAIGAWLYAVVAGHRDRTRAPGYKHVVLQPHPGGALTAARAKLAAPRGEIASAWRSAPRRFDWEVTVPANSTATAHLPVPAQARVTEGGKPLDRARASAGSRAPGTRSPASWFPVAFVSPQNGAARSMTSVRQRLDELLVQRGLAASARKPGL